MEKMIRTRPNYWLAIILVLILGCAAFIPGDLSAEIYSYTDEDGVLDTFDTCSDSPSSDVDAAGCTKPQFCEKPLYFLL